MAALGTNPRQLSPPANHPPIPHSTPLGAFRFFVPGSCRQNSPSPRQDAAHPAEKLSLAMATITWDEFFYLLLGFLKIVF